VTGIWGAVDFSSDEPDLSWFHGLAKKILFPEYLISGAGSLGTFNDRQKPASITLSRQTSVGGRLLFAMDGTLHNREELRSRLGEPFRDSIDDSSLVLGAYDKWGEDCAPYLLGEFAFAIWDNRSERLFCCRDHIGASSFYYSYSGTRFVFASDLRLLLSIPGVSKGLNERKLAMSAQPGGDCLCHEETFHKGILSLPSATVLTVNRSNLQKHTYWSPEIKPHLVPKDEGELFDALRALLFQAVECRLPANGAVAAELSGGLDSSAVVGVAAQILECSHGQLTALSAVLPEEARNRFKDEREYVDEFASHNGVQIHYISAPGRGPFDSIENTAEFAVTPVRTSRFYLYDAFEDVAAAQNAQVVLKGSVGEFGPSAWAARYYVAQALRLRWVWLFRELRALRSVRKIPPVRYLASHLRKLLPVPLSGKPAPSALFTRSFCDEWAPRRRLSGGSRRFDHGLYQIDLIRASLRTHAHPQGWTNHGRVRTSRPWLDKRVLEFCLAVPPEMNVRGGYQRYLIRKALDGTLPKRIQWRTDKTPFSPDYDARYNSQLGKAREFVAAIGSKDPVRAVIDIDRLGSLLLQPVGPTGSGHRIARDVVPSNIYAICFLRQFAEFRP
jgi:asparagine synthase (glutamine-hydrolysing)